MSEKAWIEPLAEGIGMAQTSFVSTHHACQAWCKKGASAKARSALHGDRRTTPEKSHSQLWPLKSTLLAAFRIFNITCERVLLSVKGDAFSTGLSAMVKPLNSWASYKTREVNVRTRISSANTDQVRVLPETLRTNFFPLSERIRANSAASVDWIFGDLERIYHIV